jgi:endoglucanase
MIPERQPMTTIQQLKSDLQALAGRCGVSGSEQDVVRYLAEQLRPFADELTIDPFGNLIATRRGDGRAPSLMIAAHSDEVGLVVTTITPDGFLRFQTVGAIGNALLPATRVLVAGQYPGVIGAIPGHLARGELGEKVQPPEVLHIDIGAASAAEARALGIREGTTACYWSEIHEMHNPNLVFGKAIDNRIGCAVLLDTFSQLHGRSLPGTVYGVVNVMEEIGMRGARMTGTRLQPDYAIVLDTVPADDTPLGKNNPALAFRLGAGPVVQMVEGLKQVMTGHIIHPRVRDLILQAAEQVGQPVQLSAAYGNWTTDGAAIHVSGTGIPTGSVCIARRYAHSANEVCDLRDAEGAVKILVALADGAAIGATMDFLQG